eukprot:m.87216 g.87216  ORF g.87216 m.87216 type:complete len:337 (+) comp12235_c0_seq2:1328-2338(+)
MDGTQSGYYIREGFGAVNKTKFVINLEGGGECAKESSCKDKLKTPLGSSNFFPKAMSFYQYLDFNCDRNPVMCGWTLVHIPYCTQDLHSGMATPSADTWGLYFSGYHVFHAVIEQLSSKYGLDNATEVILTGESAGGIGVWYHLAYLDDLLPHARVVGAPIAGFYFPAYPYMGVNHTQSGLADFRPPAWEGHYNLWNSSVNAKCKEAHPNDPWVCMLSNTSYHFIDTPVFVTEAQTDQVVILYHDWMPPMYLHLQPEMEYLEEWHANMTQALSPAIVSKTDGVFNPACFIHTSFSSSAPTINGYTYISAFNEWYTKGTPLSLTDDCGVMCNPTCPT